MKTRIDLAKEWFQKADNDLLNIENNLKSEKIPVDTVCFHAQQAVEKYLKGFLIYNDVDFEYVHDLEYLVDLSKEIDKDFEELYEIVKNLNEYSVIIRYPYNYMPTVEEAKEAYKSALKVKEFILTKLKI